MFASLKADAYWSRLWNAIDLLVNSWVTFVFMSSDVMGYPAASNILIASLKHLIASLNAYFLKCILPRSFKTVSLSSRSLMALSSADYYGLGGVASTFASGFGSGAFGYHYY